MSIKHVTQLAIFIALLMTSMATAQYEEEPYIEGFVGANLTLPMGHIKNDLEPDSLNAENGFGFDIGIGYYFTNHLIGGIYFNIQNMGVKDFELTHRVFEFGAYGKYLLLDLSESKISPYLKLSAGLNFSKFGTKVFDDSQPVFRELSYKPSLGTAAALGFQWKTNDRGGIFLEFDYNYDFVKDNTGEFESIDYSWKENNSYLMIKAGVVFNIGPKE